MKFVYVFLTCISAIAAYEFPAPIDDSLTLVLIGKTGSGKSTVGNSLLGDDVFPSSMSMVSKTRHAQSAFGKYNDTDLLVIDTPGFFDTRDEVSLEDVLKEISRCMQLASANGGGIDAVILTLRADDRLTEEHIKAVRFFKQLFGDDIMDHVIILLTRKDQLDQSGITMHEHLQHTPPFFQDLLTECNHRVMAFGKYKDGQNTENTQVDQLMHMVANLRQENDNRRFNDDIFKGAKKIVEEHEKINTDGYTYECHQNNAFVHKSESVLSQIVSFLFDKILVAGTYKLLVALF